MRIDDLNRSSVTQGTEQAAPAGAERAQGKQPASPESGSAAASDQVQVSALAQSLAAPDSGRLDQLRLEVESGNYNVPASAVASALIDAHLKD